MIAAVGLVAACQQPVSQVPVVDPAARDAEAENQRLLLIDQQIKDYQRLDRIAYRILKANVDICGDHVAKHTGVSLRNKYFFPEDYYTAATRAELGERLTVVSLAPDSPAEGSGLRLGDKLWSVDGTEIIAGKDAIKKYNEALDAHKTNAPISLTVERHGERLTYSMGFDRICNYPYYIKLDPDVNAYATGTEFFADTGLMRAFADDDYVATVVGHEMAHNIMGHVAKQKSNAALGTVVDYVVALGLGIYTGGYFGNKAIGAYSQDFETEADYVGLYAMARAGFHYNKAPNVWREMTVAVSPEVKEKREASHPSNPQRYLLLSQTAAEIDSKRAQGLPLLPNVKPTAPPVVSTAVPGQN